MSVAEFIEKHPELWLMPYMTIYRTIKTLIDEGLIDDYVFNMEDMRRNEPVGRI